MFSWFLDLSYANRASANFSLARETWVFTIKNDYIIKLHIKSVVLKVSPVKSIGGAWQFYFKQALGWYWKEKQ